MASLAVLILAAGQGTRMKSDRIKVLHELSGRPMIDYVIETASLITGSKPFIVVGYQADAVRQSTGNRAHFILQEEQKGTGHAVMQAEPYLKGRFDEVVVLYGDCPLLSPKTVADLIDARRRAGAGCSVLTTEVDDPSGYGRVIRSPGSCDRVARIVEHKDATREERAIREINTGVYCFDTDVLFSALPQVSSRNVQGEFYITDAVSVFASQGISTVACKTPSPEEGLGINDRRALADMAAIMRKRILDSLMLSGVTIEDPRTTYIDAGVTVGMDTIVRPNTFISGSTRIGRGCVIGPETIIEDSIIGDNVKVIVSVVEQSSVESDVNIGPFSHLRPGADIRGQAEIGNYVEIKNSVIGTGTKAHHHCYIGDATVGKGVNYSAGAITVNYDGKRKHRTVIEDGAFIGCNVNLIAPVTIGAGSFAAAGSTITDEVPPDALAIARERQTNKEGWALKRPKQFQAGPDEQKNK